MTLLSGVDSGRRSLWPELPNAHTPPVSAWSNQRVRTGSTAASTANKQVTRPSYAAIASTPLADNRGAEPVRRSLGSGRDSPSSMPQTMRRASLLNHSVILVLLYVLRTTLLKAR